MKVPAAEMGQWDGIGAVLGPHAWAYGGDRETVPLCL